MELLLTDSVGVAEVDVEIHLAYGDGIVRKTREYL